MVSKPVEQSLRNNLICFSTSLNVIGWSAKLLPFSASIFSKNFAVICGGTPV